MSNDAVFPALAPAVAPTRRTFLQRAGCGFGAVALSSLLADRSFASEVSSELAPLRATDTGSLHAVRAPSTINRLSRRSAGNPSLVWCARFGIPAGTPYLGVRSLWGRFLAVPGYHYRSIWLRFYFACAVKRHNPLKSPLNP